MARLTDEKIAEIRKVYDTLGTYAATARKVGCTPATVKKYVDAPAVIIKEDLERHIFCAPIPPVSEMTLEYFTTNADFLFKPTDEEKADLETVRREK